jgi:tRNA threonylcarbamoyladenosine biosynthesis protein TsaB
LAVETTTAFGSVAVLEDGEVRASRALDAGRYSTQLLTAITSVVERAGKALSAIDAFAVASGPGSFTGVRIGLVAIKGLVEVSKRPAVAVSTLAALAAMVALDQPALAALDASRQEVYWGEYQQGPLAFARAQARHRSASQAAGPGALADATGEEGLENLTALKRRALATARLGARLVTADDQLAATIGAQALVAGRELALGVGCLGRELLLGGMTETALELDANYIRRSDAELFSLPRLERQLERR